MKNSNLNDVLQHLSDLQFQYTRAQRNGKRIQAVIFERQIRVLKAIHGL